MSKTKITNERLLDILPKLFRSRTPLSQALLPWTWLGDDFHEALPGTDINNWPYTNMAGYVIPASEPIPFDNETPYWGYIVGYYFKDTNVTDPTYGIQYVLYIENETEHVCLRLSGFEYYVTNMSNNIVGCGKTYADPDPDGDNILDWHLDIKQAMHSLSEKLTRRELVNNSPYLDCLAIHHADSLVSDLPCYDPLRYTQTKLPSGKTLVQFIKGE